MLASAAESDYFSSVEGGGDAAVRLPDLLGQVVELRQVLLAVLHLLPPARRRRCERIVSRSSGGMSTPLEVEFLLGRDDADRGLRAR